MIENQLIESLQRTLAETNKLLKDLVEKKEKASNHLPAYRLKKDMPMLGAGSVFVHDIEDSDKGSWAHGCLKLAWYKHSCQRVSNQYAWVAETHVLPGQCINNTEWFEEIPNTNGDYHL